MNWREIPIPELMKDLPRDHRGIPVPATIFVDKQNKAHFTINDPLLREKVIREELCAICGKKLLRGRWSAGGPGSAFHPNGAYIDPPMHYECCRYAMQACPYIALPSYSNRIDAKTYKNDEIGIFIDPTVIATKPEPFVMVMHVGETYTLSDLGLVHSIKPKTPYRRIEYWLNGTQLSEEEGRARSDAYMQAQYPTFEKQELWQKPRLVIKR